MNKHRLKRRSRAAAGTVCAALLFVPGLLQAELVATPAPPPYSQPENDQLSAATRAIVRGDEAQAVSIYRTLEQDDNIDLRCEARVRHAQLMIAKSSFSRAAVLLRATLDERPDWQRARLMMAHVLARLGREPSARRELRQAQVTPMPTALVPQVDTFADDLLKVPPIAGTIEVAFAPNSNIDRASSATLLNPEVLPFSLTKSPPVPSGTGLRLSSFINAYLPVSSRILATARLTLHDHFYQAGRYNDHVGTAEIGGVAQWHRERLRATVGETLRVYGASLNSKTAFIAVNWLSDVGPRSQLELGVNLGDIHYENIKNRDGKIYALSLAYEYALSTRSGTRIAIVAQRETARIPGYESTLGGGNALVWQEVGKTTVFASLAVQRLAASGPIAPSPVIRKDWLVRAGSGVAIRRKLIFGFAPTIRTSYTRNYSTIANQEYSNLEGEFALNKAF